MVPLILGNPHIDPRCGVACLFVSALSAAGTVLSSVPGMLVPKGSM